MALMSDAAVGGLRLVGECVGIEVLERTLDGGARMQRRGR